MSCQLAYEERRNGCPTGLRQIPVLERAPVGVLTRIEPAGGHRAVGAPHRHPPRALPVDGKVDVVPQQPGSFAGPKPGQRHHQDERLGHAAPRLRGTGLGHLQRLLDADHHIGGPSEVLDEAQTTPRSTLRTPAEQHFRLSAPQTRMRYPEVSRCTWRGARAAESDSLLTPKGRFVI
jgi:hypothetical protein